MPYIRAQVSDDAYNGWRDLAARHGVSVAALIEAAGLRLPQRDEDGEKSSADVFAGFIELARSIDSDRRRRR